MINGLFHGTMADLPWTAIQACADQNAIVLLPLGVIEEHGPHLCLATDIYTAHVHSLFIKQHLEAAGHPVVIAPPFYWGVCQATGGFIGSFKIRKETARALLFDILASLADFGFRAAYGVNAHGDVEHSVAIMEAFKAASEQLPIRACYPFSRTLLPHYGLTGSEPYICPVEPQAVQPSAAACSDVHAGDIETATIHHFYPALANAQLAATLPPVPLADDRGMDWLFGGHIHELSPNGYLGAPADFPQVDVLAHIEDVADRVSTAILEHLGK